MIDVVENAFAKSTIRLVFARNFIYDANYSRECIFAIVRVRFSVNVQATTTARTTFARITIASVCTGGFALLLRYHFTVLNCTIAVDSDMQENLMNQIIKLLFRLSGLYICGGLFGRTPRTV